jgi:hypothetical protein
VLLNNIASRSDAMQMYMEGQTPIFGALLFLPTFTAEAAL